MKVVATAGHVDHGKSSLIIALTGTDPDRFPEEKARGLTIDLGFAFMTLPSGEEVGFVDVPGHVKFVKNMLAGVGAVEVALLVVAANEGWMPQTEEHLRILDLLGIEHGLIALTKAGVVDGETLDLARLELEDRLAGPRGSAASAWPVVVVDSPTGRGVDELRDALDAVLAAAPPARDVGRPRLWIDRVFAPRGAGTVVTGTLVGGSLALEDEVVIEPGHRRARLRAIETHHARLEVAPPGTRVALNLAGIEHDAMRRGDAVVYPGQWAAAQVVDAELLLIADVPRRGILSAHVGSGEHAVRVRLLDREGRYARLHFDAGLPLAPGDRLVLRSSGRGATVGGATVVDVAPARRAADALVRVALPLHERVLAARAWPTESELVTLAGVDDTGAAALADDLVARGLVERVGGAIVALAALTELRARARDAVLSHHRAHPTARGVDLASLASQLGLDAVRLRAALRETADLVIERDTVRHTEHGGSVLDDPAARRLLAELDDRRFSPPDPHELGVSDGVVRALAREGLVVELDDVVFSTGALDEARRLVAEAVVTRGTLTVAEIRDLLASTRKYVLPIANRMDAEGVTRRRGDERIPGPRATGAAGTTGATVVTDAVNTKDGADVDRGN